MSSFSYVVRCAFVDRDLMEGFLVWLRSRHIADVCAAGAETADLVRLDGAPDIPHALEIRYRFDSREAFQRYEREHAPRLRAEGLEEIARLGGAADRVAFTRTTGEMVPWGTP